jgi:hypothetical protein
MFRSPPAARRKTAPYERRNPVELPASLSLFTTSRVVALQTEPFNHTTAEVWITSSANTASIIEDWTDLHDLKIHSPEPIEIA